MNKTHKDKTGAHLQTIMTDHSYRESDCSDSYAKIGRAKSMQEPTESNPKYLQFVCLDIAGVVLIILSPYLKENCWSAG